MRGCMWKVLSAAPFGASPSLRNRFSPGTPRLKCMARPCPQRPQMTLVTFQRLWFLCRHGGGHGCGDRYSRRTLALSSHHQCQALPRSLAGSSPDPPHSTSDPGSEVLRGGSGEVPGSIRGCRREWAAKAPHPNCENPMPEGYPKRQADNDLNHCPAASFGHWRIGNLSLFRVSRFGFRISAPGKASVLRYAPAAVGAATTARRGRAVLCGWGGDAGAGHYWDIRPAVDVLAGADPNGTEDRLGGREVELGQVEIGTPGVQAHKEVVAGGAHPAARFSYEGIIGFGHAPGGVLFRGQSAPAAGDSANVAAVARDVRGRELAVMVFGAAAWKVAVDDIHGQL